MIVKRQNNMQKIILFLYIVTLNAVSGFSYIKLPDVVVVGSRTGGEAARDVQIYTSLDFLNICPATIDSIIEIFSSLYVMNRGPRGVQQDINISGSGYEQTLILFDGIPVNDPQTGHFNMNIPVSPIAIKRVEVLTGHGSVSHGSGAMGGVINIVPGQTSSGSKLLIYGGSYSTFGGELVSSQERNGAKNLLSLSMRKTGNYHPQTDSLIFSLFNMSQYKGLKFSAGYMNKEFGAYDFYTPDW